MGLADSDSHNRTAASLSELSLRTFKLELLHIRYNHPQEEACPGRGGRRRGTEVSRFRLKSKHKGPQGCDDYGAWSFPHESHSCACGTGLGLDYLPQRRTLFLSLDVL